MCRGPQHDPVSRAQGEIAESRVALGNGVASGGDNREESEESSMTDYAERSPLTVAPANEQTTNSTTTNQNGVTKMVDKETNTYSFPNTINLLELTPKEFLATLKEQLAQKGAFGTSVGYGAYWLMVKQINKQAFAFKGVAHYLLGAERFKPNAVSKALTRYERVADHLVHLYDQYDEHLGYLNAFLHDIHAKQPNYDRNGRMREEYKPLSFEPFTRRILQDGIQNIDIADYMLLMDADIDDDNEADQQAHQQLLEDDEVKRFMQQAELRTTKSNLTQALDAEPKYLYEPITREQWLDELVERSIDDIKEDAKIGAWAMAKAVARKYAKLPVIKDLVKDSKLEGIDWTTATGGKAMSLAIKAKSRVISSMNFAESMEERKDYLINQRLKKEYEDNGTIGESSLPVSGADFDERIEELDAYLRETYKEIDQLKPLVAELYTIFRRFNTTEERPMPDYRTAFQKDPAGYEDVPADATVEAIDVDVEREGKTLKRTIWLVTAMGPVRKMRDIANACRKVRWEMTKHDQMLDLDKMGEKAGDADMVSATELAALVDTLLD